MIIFYVDALSTVFVMGGSTYFALNMASKDPILTSVADRSKIMESIMLDDASLDNMQSGGGLWPAPAESGPATAFVPMLAKMYRAVTFDRYGNRRFDAANTTTLGSCSSAVCNPDKSTTNDRFTTSGYAYDGNGNLDRPINHGAPLATHRFFPKRGSPCPAFSDN